MTCIRRRIVLPSDEEVVVKFRWWLSVWYTCSNIGLTCAAILGSAGFMTAATSVIQVSFLGVSILRSQDSCWRRDRRTPWLNGNGIDNKIPAKSTWLWGGRKVKIIIISCAGIFWFWHKSQSWYLMQGMNNWSFFHLM